MSRIDQLISQYCPAGVPMVRLGEVADILYGCPFDAALFTEDSRFIPVIRIRDIVPGVPSTYYQGEYDGKYIIHKGDILVGMDGNFNLAKWNSIDGVLCQRSCKIEANRRGKVLNNFLFHYLGPVFKKIEDNTAGGSVKHLSAKAINEITIPLPPLPVQEEIVRILDAMSDLVTNLDAEISARQKQYEHAREKLLTFGEEVERKTLGEVGEMIKGTGILKSDFVDAGKPCIHYGQIHTYYRTFTTETRSFISDALYKKSKYALPGDLVIATTSEDVEACCKACAWLGEEPIAISGDAHIFHHTQNPKYLSYLFQTEQIAEQKRLAATGAKVVRVSGDSILKFSIPLPSLSVQQSIVERLDKMESLIQNLQAERALRQKQYEYYREKLLTF